MPEEEPGAREQAFLLEREYFLARVDVAMDAVLLEQVPHVVARPEHCVGCLHV
jgi:hypothetical protein